MTTMGNAINENIMYDDRTTLYLIYVQEKIPLKSRYTFIYLHAKENIV